MKTITHPFFIRYFAIICIGLFCHSADGSNQKSNSGEHRVNLFTVIDKNNVPESATFPTQKVVMLQLNKVVLSNLLSAKHENITLVLPTETPGKTIDVILSRGPVQEEGGKVGSINSEGIETIDYKPGIHYRGFVDGKNQSVSAFSFFDNMVMGLISIKGEPGNFNVGPIQSHLLNSTYVFYNDIDLPEAFNLKCGTNENMVLSNSATQNRHQNIVNQMSTNCVKNYIECDYQMFLDNGSNTTNVANLVTGLFNQVIAVYDIENVSMKISDINIWTVVDPYSGLGTAGDHLDNFRLTRTVHNGDIAHLLSTKSLGLGGVAWVDVLCNSSFGYAFSNIDNSYANFPTYSWTIMVFSHEAGHNLGSPHTQSCSWVGGAIDNCTTTEGGCPPGPAPTNGGTVMSYCHGAIYGINLANSFGPQPGALIRSKVNGAACLVSCFCMPSVSITASPGNTSCLGEMVTFYTTSSNAGPSPTYQWRENGFIVGGNTSTYSATNLSSGDEILCRLYSNDVCADPGQAPAVSNTITMQVNNAVTPSIQISTAAQSVCQNQGVMFNSSITDGGPGAGYTWRLNGVNTGVTTSNFSLSTLADGDIVSCDLTSSISCASPATVSSNSIVMDVTTSVTPAVDVIPSSNTTCLGASVTFTAIPFNEGTSPGYSWLINNVATGFSGLSFTTSNLVNNDEVICAMTSSNPCASPTTVTSNPVTMNISNTTVIPSTGLLAWYPFNGNLLDNSGNNFDGQNVGAIATEDRFNNLDNSYRFDGSGENVSIGNPVGLNNFSTALTVSAWVFLGENNSSQTALVSKWKFVTAEDQYLLWLYEKKPNFATGNYLTGASGVQSPTVLSDSTWYHIVGTWNNSGLHSLYINGQFNTSRVIAGFNSINNTSTAALRIGTQDSIYRAFKGKIDDVRIYNRVLTSQEIANLYNESENASITIDASANNVCAGQSVTFTSTTTAGGVSPTYQWKVNGLTTGGNTANFTSTALNDGDIVTCHLLSSDACVIPDVAISNEVQMVVNSNFNLTVNIQTASNIICQNDSAVFVATPPVGIISPNFQWKINGINVGTNSQNYTALILNHNDTVTCEMTSLNPCVAPTLAISNNIIMTVLPYVSPSILISIPTIPLCQGDTLTINSTISNGGTTPSYQWYLNNNASGTNSNQFVHNNVTNNDNIYCVLTNSENCAAPPSSSSNTLILNVSTPIVPVISISGNTLQSTTVGTYQWFHNGMPVTGAVQQTHVPTMYGYYHVATVDPNGCTETSDSIQVTWVDISEFETSNNSFRFYPNPTEAESFLELPPNEKFTVGLYTIEGKLLETIFDSHTGSEKTTLEVKTGKLSDGVYFLRLTNNDRSHSIKVLVMH